MNYPMYGNNSQYYMQNLQDMRDRIDNQMKQYQQSQIQILNIYIHIMLS